MVDWVGGAVEDLGMVVWVGVGWVAEGACMPAVLYSYQEIL